MDHYEKFCCAVDLLVEANEQFRERFKDEKWFSVLGPVGYAMDIATVHVNPNRRAGKTECIKDRAKAGDLIVVGGYEQALQYSATPAQVYWTTGNLPYPTERFNRIYVDEPWLVFKDIRVEDFYRALCKDAHQTFIFLGRN